MNATGSCNQTGYYVTPTGCCSTNPCDACPMGFPCLCSNGAKDCEPGLKICVDCECGFCDSVIPNQTACCEFNGQNNCKDEPTAENLQCNLQNDFYPSFPGSGSVCTGVEISDTAIENGCGCQPNQFTPCTFDTGACTVCTAEDLVSVAINASATICKDCFNCIAANCSLTACMTAAKNTTAMIDCYNERRFNVCCGNCTNTCKKL